MYSVSRTFPLLKGDDEEEALGLGKRLTKPILCISVYCVTRYRSLGLSLFSKAGKKINEAKMIDSNWIAGRILTAEKRI